MREILFRGRTKDGKWHTGWYVKATKSIRPGFKWHEDWIVSAFSANGGWVAPLARYAVDAGTIGQYTGLKDKNGVKIFEGDIVRVGCENYPVIFNTLGGCAEFALTDGVPFGLDYVYMHPIEVVGNIYDNPELLKEESE